MSFERLMHVKFTSCIEGVKKEYYLVRIFLLTDWEREYTYIRSVYTYIQACPYIPVFHFYKYDYTDQIKLNSYI